MPFATGTITETVTTGLINLTIEYPAEAHDRGNERNTLRTSLNNTVRGQMERLATEAARASKYQTTSDEFGVEQSTGAELGSYALMNYHPAYRFLYHGSRAHEIVARTGPYLVFEGAEGHLVKVRKVNHPGVMPDQPVISLVEQSETKIAAAAAGALSRWAGTLGTKEG